MGDSSSYAIKPDADSIDEMWQYVDFDTRSAEVTTVSMRRWTVYPVWYMLLAVIACTLATGGALAEGRLAVAVLFASAALASIAAISRLTRVGVEVSAFGVRSHALHRTRTLQWGEIMQFRLSRHFTPYGVPGEWVVAVLEGGSRVRMANCYSYSGQKMGSELVLTGNEALNGLRERYWFCRMAVEHLNDLRSQFAQAPSS